jgi:prolycopene isomerase
MRSSVAPHQVFDAVIFGSGLAGLACARRLAVSGQKVIVLEKAKELGGHLLPFERSGVTFEVGLHYIADMQKGSHFAEALEHLSIHLDPIFLDEEFEALVFESLDSSLSAENKIISYKTPLQSFVEQLKNRFPAEVAGIDKYFYFLDLVWQFARRLKFPVTTQALLRQFFAHSEKIRLIKLATRALADVFDDCRLSHPLREILSIHHVLIGVPPSRVSAFLHMTVQRYYFQRAGFVRGGGRAMIHALLHPEVIYKTQIDATFEKIVCPEILRLGARFRVDNGQGEEIFTKNIIWTPDPRTLERSAKGIHLSAFLREKFARVETPHALVVGYFATQRPLDDYGLLNRNYWLMGSLDSEACYLENDPVVLAQRAPLYLSMGSLRDPEAVQQQNKLGAQGVFQAMFLCPPSSDIWGGQDPDSYRVPESKGGYGRHYRVLKEAVLENLTHRLLSQWPQLQGEIVWRELGSPLTHRRYLNSMTFNGYGFSPTVSDLLWKRPSAWTNEPGLFLCGAYIRPSHGIVTALVNGVGLAQFITSCEH